MSRNAYTVPPANWTADIDSQRSSPCTSTGSVSAGCASEALAHPLPVLDHVVDAPSHGLPCLDAKSLRGCGIPEANDSIGVDEEYAVVDELECLDRVGSRLDLAVEERVVECRRGAA